MTEAVALEVDGRAVNAAAGVTVAAALANAGVTALRASAGGEPRGVLCAMGICYECRVAIDGIPHRRACMEIVRGGMRVETGASAARGLPSPEDSEREALEGDVAVVGAGPAGVAAACRAAERGARVVVLDEGLAPGGQIHRHLPGASVPSGAAAWLERLAKSGAVLRGRCSVFDAFREEGRWHLSAETPSGVLEVRAARVIVATGARELFLPFPGWTLPGVMGAGAAQAMGKSGASLAGRIAVVAGSGPLLLPVAASLAKAGARVAVVAEQAGMTALARFGAALALRPGKLLEAARYRARFAGAPYRTGAWVVEARGRERLESVVVAAGGVRREVRCEIAAVGWGLSPNTELARLMGCDQRGGRVVVGRLQETSVAGVFAAGEPCGVAGLEVAIAEGEIAGLAAAGAAGPEKDLQSPSGARSRGRRLAQAMDRAFRPRRELRALALPGTVVCRCEDATRAALDPCSGAREAKLVSRAGMGPCQGRVCGPMLSFLFGWDSDTVRPPVKPAALGHLVSRSEESA